MRKKIDINSLEAQADVLRAIAHPLRIWIIILLQQHGELTVTEIYEKMDIEQAIASHHLGILKNKGVLRAQRDGKNTNYSLGSSDFYELIALLAGNV
jgi:ArsR family transcriptional regulator